MTEYVSRRPPRVKQAEALEFIKDKRVAALLMAMRTGKTKVVIDDWARRDISDLLVIAPAGAYLPWEEALHLEIPESVMRYVMPYVWVSKRAGTKRDTDRRNHFLRYAGSRVLIVNSEALSTVKSARALCEGFLKQRPGMNMIAVDESVVIKNMKSSCSKFVVGKLAPLAHYKRILTGLVSPQSPLDVYQQFRFLDTDIFPETWSAFRDRYCNIRRICTLPKDFVMRKFVSVFSLRNKNLPEPILREVGRKLWPDMDTDGWPVAMLRSQVYMAPESFTRDEMIAAIFRAGRYVQSVPVIEGYRNVEELNQRIAPYSFRVRLEDCYDMPASDYSFRDVEMTKEQEKAYEEIREFATTQLSEMAHVTAPNVIAQMLRMHQVLCGHVKDEEGNVHEIPENRTAAVVDFLEDYDGKAIIWCSYDMNIRKLEAALVKAFGKGSVARFWGGNRDTREDEEARFKKDPMCRFMLATPDAGGRGRDWSVANLVVYFSSKNNLDHRAQSEERAKAVGKKTPVAYVDFRCQGTVEDKIIEALRQKINLADVITGDDFREWLV